MLTVVKKRRTNKNLFEIKGNIPENVIDFLKDNFGNSFEVIEDKDLINIFETD
jgi:helix-turn-helix protein